MPIYLKGDIVFIRHFRFLDNSIDFKTNGHPFLILNDINNLGENAYFLKISSKNRSRYNQNQYKIEKKLYRTSYVNLEDLYIFSIDYIIPARFHLNDNILKEIYAKTESSEIKEIMQKFNFI